MQRLLLELPNHARAYLDGLEILIQVGSQFTALPLNGKLDDIMTAQLRRIGAIRSCARQCAIGTPCPLKLGM
ncbi:MAG: hypothetical protein ACK4RV_13650 [Caulobacter sp.]